MPKRGRPGERDRSPAGARAERVAGGERRGDVTEVAGDAADQPGAQVAALPRREREPAGERDVARPEAADRDLGRRPPGVLLEPAGGDPLRRRDQAGAEGDPAQREADCRVWGAQHVREIRSERAKWITDGELGSV